MSNCSRAFELGAGSLLAGRAVQSIRHLCLAGLVLLCSWCLPGSVLGQSTVASAGESQIKAAFLYKFGSYVEWPAQTFERPDTALVIGVVESESTAAALAQIADSHPIDGRPVSVRRLHPGESLDGVQVVFIGRMDAKRLDETLAAAKGRPMLTVTESDPWLAVESMINFVVVGDKVRFDVSLPAVEQGSLKISARLLGVARKVIPRPS